MGLRNNHKQLMLMWQAGDILQGPLFIG